MAVDPVFEYQMRRLATDGVGESSQLDFKGRWDPSNKYHWPEIIRDVVAMLNTDGGVLVFGCASSGRCIPTKLRKINAIGQHTVVDKILSATGENYGDITFIDVERGGVTRRAWVIQKSSRLLLFNRTAERDAAVGHRRRRRMSFIKGLLLVRHGSKTEPATAADLDRAILERARAVLAPTLSTPTQDVHLGGTSPPSAPISETHLPTQVNTNLTTSTSP
jgi:hypothetical protein